MWYSERQIGRIGQNLAKRLKKVELRNNLSCEDGVLDGVIFIRLFF